MSSSIDDAWGKPFLEPERSELPAASAAPAVAARDATMVSNDAPDADESLASTSAVTPDTLAVLIEEIRLMRKDAIRHSYGVMGMLALVAVALFMYLDRIHSQIRLRDKMHRASAATA